MSKQLSGASGEERKCKIKKFHRSYLRVSAAVIERTYGHRHPDYTRAAAQAITSKQLANVSRQGGNVSLFISLVSSESEPIKRRKPNEFMVADAVYIERVSAKISPANREINRESRETVPFWRLGKVGFACKPGTSADFPLAKEQGNFERHNRELKSKIRENRSQKLARWQ